LGDGSLLDIVSHRPDSGAGTLYIEIYQNGVLLSSSQQNIGFISALVDQGTLYVFGVTNWIGGARNKIVMISTRDLQTWTAPITVLDSAPNRSFF